VRIVLDTNVIVAAFAARGICAEVVEVCVSSHTLVISEHILAEVNSAFLKKVKLPKEIIHDVIDYLRNIAETVDPDHIDNAVCRDKHDLPIIGTATKGNADFIVTGDADLLALKSYRGIDIMTPRELWNRLR
jgi:putative PIN family toxin of toxin-antitoxin system